MMPNLLIAIGAGAASALLFASVASGSMIAILLFYLAPLPVLIAALSWTHWTGLAAAALAAVGLGLAIGPFFVIPYLIGVGIPAWWLGYLALLARPAAPPDGLDWYPVGRLVVWAALIAAGMVASVILNLGTDEESYRRVLRGMFEQVLSGSSRAPAGAPPANAEQTGRLLDLLVTVVPIGAAVLATITNVVNLWLAARIVAVSGRLKRPWPDLAGLRLPGTAAVLLAFGCAAVLLFDGIPGVIAGVLAASMTVAYAIQGFAVLHTITRGMASRGVVLGGSYAVVLVLGWPVLAMTLLGLVDNALDIRTRFAPRAGPPAAT
jgi:hypothetical protein